jgi:hypothetical protein
MIRKDRPVVADLHEPLALAVLEAEIELIGPGVDHVRKDYRVLRNRRCDRSDRL